MSYTITKPADVTLADFEAAVLDRAMRIIEKNLRRAGVVLDSPGLVRDLLTLKLATREHEIFAVLFLDTRNQLLGYEEMFRGTIDGASVHPREVVKACMQYNAAAAIVAHNHPSGVAEPSRADRAITRRLSEALALVDVRLLDHFIIGGTTYVSFAERGWL